MFKTIIILNILFNLIFVFIDSIIISKLEQEYVQIYSLKLSIEIIYALIETVICVAMKDDDEFNKVSSSISLTIIVVTIYNIIILLFENLMSFYIMVSFILNIVINLIILYV